MFIFMPIYVNGKFGGWEGHYIIEPETEITLMAMVRELPDVSGFVKSGLLANDFQSLNAWWREAQAGERIRLECLEQQRKQENELLEKSVGPSVIGRRLLAEDILSPP